MPTCLVVLLGTAILTMVGHDGASFASGWESLWHHAMGMVAGILLGTATGAAGVTTRAVAVTLTVVGALGGLTVGMIRWT